MEKKYILPASTFLGGFFIWLVLFIIIITADKGSALPTWLPLATGLVPGILILFSGISCKLAGGPAFGNFFRAGVLFVFAALCLWKISMTVMLILLTASLLLFLLAFTAKK